MDHGGEAIFSAPGAATLLKAKQRQVITRLFKSYLFLLEELTDEHDEAMRKLREALPQDLKGYVNLADYLSDGKVETNRKKVLAAGNDAVRELEQIVDGLRLSE